MLVLQKAVKMVWNLPEVMRVAYAFMAVVLLWMALWSFGAAGVVASSMGDGGRWWLLVVSWQVLLFILSVLIGLTGYGFRFCKLISSLLLLCMHAGPLCKLILDRCCAL
jgi:hypothetical protein